MSPNPRLSVIFFFYLIALTLTDTLTGCYVVFVYLFFVFFVNSPLSRE